KDALLDEVIDDLEAHTREVMDQVDTIVRSGGDLSPLLWRELHREHRRGILFAVLSAESVDPEHPARFRISRLRLVYERMTENYLRAFAEKGQLRPGVDPVQASRALVSLLLSLPIRSATVGSLQSTPTDSPAEDIRALLELYLLPAPTGGTDSPSTPAD
ncbi:MAG: hypothetical protein Q4G40_10265, partial [Brachybacterium sp.]|nr:hypothetical protein [Brachybacterium sp.]